MWGGSDCLHKATFNGLGREWQEGGSGECSQLDRKNRFRRASPSHMEKRQGAQPGSLPKTCGTWGGRGREKPPRGEGRPKIWRVIPVALLEGLLGRF